MICLCAIGNIKQLILVYESESSWREGPGSISVFATSSCLVLGKTVEVVEELCADPSKDGAVLMVRMRESETLGSVAQNSIHKHT